MQPQVLSLECPGPTRRDRVAVRVWGPRPAPAVVCVHGLSRNATDFDELAQALAPTHRVVCIDMPGRGESPPLDDASRYGEATYLSIVRHTIEALGLGPVHWIGTSMGGLLGMKFAATEPARVRSLVLNDVGAELDGAALAQLRQSAAENVSFEDLRRAEDYFRVRYAAFGPLSDARWGHLARHGVWRRADERLTPAFDTRAVSRAELPARVDLWATWHAVTCRTFVLRGGRSALLDRAVCERMAASGPGGHWLEIPEAGHAPDLHGAARIAPVVRFLQGDSP